MKGNNLFVYYSINKLHKEFKSNVIKFTYNIKLL